MQDLNRKLHRQAQQYNLAQAQTGGSSGLAGGGAFPGTGTTSAALLGATVGSPQPPPAGAFGFAGMDLKQVNTALNVLDGDVGNAFVPEVHALLEFEVHRPGFYGKTFVFDSVTIAIFP